MDRYKETTAQKVIGIPSPPANVLTWFVRVPSSVSRGVIKGVTFPLNGMIQVETTYPSMHPCLLLGTLAWYMGTAICMVLRAVHAGTCSFQGHASGLEIRLQ